MSKAAEMLAESHGGSWMDHPVYGAEDWRREVGEGNTRLSYWDWVIGQAEANGDTDF